MTPNKPGNGETAETGSCRLEVCGGVSASQKIANTSCQAKYLFSINKITKFVVFTNSHSDLLEAHVMSECGGH